MTNLGTINNQERTGDRDLYFSWLMRQPHSITERLRSCDFDGLPDTDVAPYCDRCALPFIIFEATRQLGYKATRYTKRLAEKLGVDSYLVRHTGRMGSDINGSDRTPSSEFEMTRLRDGKSGIAKSEKEFCEFIERKFREHFKECLLRPRY